MKVFVAGATGVLGRRLVPGLRAGGHDVVGLSRGPGNDATIRSLGGEPRRSDLFDVDSLVRAAEGADVIVRTATAIPDGIRFRARDWETNDRVRREGTLALTEAAARVHAKAYVQESIVWLAAPPDGSEFDETAPASPRLWFASAAEAEEIARVAAARHGFAAASLRFGTFYSADSDQTRLMGERLVRGKLPILGAGDALWSCTHVDDAASALALAIEALASGVWHVVDDRPVSSATFFETFAAALEAPKPRHVPLWVARLALGSGTMEFLTLTTRTSSRKIREDLGWSPRYPTVREGLLQVADVWKEEGFMPARRGAR